MVKNSYVILSVVFSAAAHLCTAAVFDVREYGAKGDGVAKDTAAIQKAVDAASAAGGGTVEFAPGTYLTGSIWLRDNVDFHLGCGVTLKGSPDPTAVHRTPLRPSAATTRLAGTCCSASALGT